MIYVGFNEPDVEVCLLNGTFTNLRFVKNGSHEPEFSVSIEVNSSSSRPTDGEEDAIQNIIIMNNPSVTSVFFVATLSTQATDYCRVASFFPILPTVLVLRFP